MLSANAASLLGIPGEESTSIGVYIKDLRTDKVLVDHNSQCALTPASILKAVTTATALSELGTEYRFNTTVKLRGTQSGSVWKGDLLIIGGADPTLESSYFKNNQGFVAAICRQLTDKGIDRIDGRIITEESLSNSGPIAQWEIEDVAYGYGAGLFGINYRDNVFTLFPVTKVTKPFVPELDVVVEKSTDGNDLIRGIYSNRLIVRRTNITDKQQSVTTSMPDPAAVLRAEIANRLEAAGITLTDRASASTAKSPSEELLSWTSPRSGDIMRSLMVRSDNMFAEGMLRAIAPGATRSAAIKKEKDLWTSRGVSAAYTIINDGSGLTRANKISPRFLGGILEYMAESKASADYVSFFPKVGVEGTVKSFLAQTSLKGKLVLKTGSVSSVQCYAGYKVDADNKPTHVVVIMVNGFFCERSAVRGAVEKLLLNTFK